MLHRGRARFAFWFGRRPAETRFMPADDRCNPCSSGSSGLPLLSNGRPLRLARSRIVRRQGGFIGVQRTTASLGALSNRSEARSAYRLPAEYRFRQCVFESFGGKVSASNGLPLISSGRQLPPARSRIVRRQGGFIGFQRTTASLGVFSNRSEARSVHRLPADYRFPQHVFESFGGTA